MNLARSSLTVFAANAGSAGVGFVGIVLFARELGPALMGSFFLFQAAGGAFRVVADAGLTTATKKRLSEAGTERTETYSTGLVAKGALLLFVGLVILAASRWINEYLGSDLAVWLVVSVATQEAAWFFLSVLHGEQRVSEAALIRMLRRVVWVVLGLWLVADGWGLQGIVAGYVGGFGVVAVVSAVRTSTKAGTPGSDQLYSLTRYAKYNAVSRVGNYTYNWLDVAVLGLFVSQADIGIYEYAWQVTLPLVFVSRALGSAIFPQLSRWQSERATARIETVVSKSLGTAQFFLIPAFAGSLILSEEIFEHLFREPALSGALVLVILMVEKIVQSGSAILRRSLDAIDAPDRAARVAVVTTCLTALLLVVLVPPLGIVGAALATTAGTAVGSGMYYRYISEYLQVDLPVRLVAWVGVSSTIMATVLHLVRSLFPVDSAASLGGYVLLGAVLYLGVSLSVPVLRREAIRPGLNALT
jgi:O-antigen/teichoic acid export membrane protein